MALHKKLNAEKNKDTSFSSLEKPELLFRVLYQWHCKNPTATKKDLALYVEECGHHKEAVKLDSSRLVIGKFFSLIIIELASYMYMQT